MPEIIRDPVWQFIGVTTAVLISFVIYFMQKQKKKLSYEIITNTRLLSVKEEYKSKISIIYDGKPVTDVHLLEINILNSGNTPIQKNEYETNIRINCGEEATILTADMVFADPPDINPSIRVEKTWLILEPVLLNKGDNIIFKIIATQIENIKVEGRIIGVKRIDKYVAAKHKLFYFGGAALVMLFALVNSHKKYFNLGILNIILYLIGVGLFIYSDISDNIRKSKYRKRMKKFRDQKDT